MRSAKLERRLKGEVKTNGSPKRKRTRASQAWSPRKRKCKLAPTRLHFLMSLCSTEPIVTVPAVTFSFFSLSVSLFHLASVRCLLFGFVPPLCPWENVVSGNPAQFFWTICVSASLFTQVLGDAGTLCMHEYLLYVYRRRWYGK